MPSRHFEVCYFFLIYYSEISHFSVCDEAIPVFYFVQVVVSVLQTGVFLVNEVAGREHRVALSPFVVVFPR